MFLDCPFVLPFGLCLPLFGLLIVYSDHPPIVIVRWSRTHACSRITLVSCPQHVCLLMFDPACALTTFLIKLAHGSVCLTSCRLRHRYSLMQLSNQRLCVSDWRAALCIFTHVVYRLFSTTAPQFTVNYVFSMYVQWVHFGNTVFTRFVLFTCLHNFQHLYWYKYSAFHQYSDKNKVKYLRILVLLVYNKIIIK